MQDALCDPHKQCTVHAAYRPPPYVSGQLAHSKQSPAVLHGPERSPVVHSFHAPAIQDAEGNLWAILATATRFPITSVPRHAAHFSPPDTPVTATEHIVVQGLRDLDGVYEATPVPVPQTRAVVAQIMFNSLTWILQDLARFLPIDALFNVVRRYFQHRALVFSPNIVLNPPIRINEMVGLD